MTVVIGFNFPIVHDNAVAVIIDGKLVFAAEEERFTRHKHSPYEPPINALVQAYKFLIKRGVKPDDVDAYAVNFHPRLLPKSFRDIKYFEEYFIGYFKGYGIPISEAIKGFFKSLFFGNATYLDYAKKLVLHAAKKAGYQISHDIKIYPVEHHLTHAATAYYFSGFNSATVLTIDGRGEVDSTVVWKVKNGEFEKIVSIPIWDGSIGELWDFVTMNIGFDWLEGPGKAMGLAPYGKSDSEIEMKFLEVFRLEDKDYPYILSEKFRKKKILDLAYSSYYSNYQVIADYITGGKINWNPKGTIDQRAANIAYELQSFTDNLLLHIGKWAKSHTGEDKVALAGGVALNAKANMELYYSHIFNDVFIFPAANDAGGPIGAAAYVYEHVLGGKMQHGRLKNVYLGPEYDDETIKKVIQDSKFRAEYVGDDVSAVVDIVAKGGIITWYQGRAELGPRALGNRSIVADPTRKDYWRLVNDIKGREWWRPLAPSLLDEDKDVYFKDPVSHEFMILMLRYKDEEVCKRVPVTCHVDFTARPQTVTKDQNRTWYDLIKGFKDLKGEGLIMNTSFNLAGEPLVETPQDALRSFAVKGFDAMYMQGWIIYKK
ncbi:carbamoyltransferase [Sulfolobus sp. S-194]|uniref:carbamoyltransferase family protein n=1 Tax=Sulfolobus sp. S-194 TaxID=2512240 RepID=UPI001437178D|nr:carbamoyltransferase C-terminal domain-containing protein [Sulfolobus sp. S-194]QIW24508.1 carbamoyltransferase [Sulfolobus sp. S-194]